MLGQTGVCLRVLLAIGSGGLAALTIFIAPSSAVSQESRRAKMSSQTLFDDFNYSSYSKLAKHGWIIRTAAGWPGVPGAIWGTRGVSFPADQEQRGNRLLRMISSTDGNGLNTRQTQICHQRKYLEGTYAARVRFVDVPTDGPSGVSAADDES